MLKKILFTFFIFINIAANATHNRAGEITYKWVSGLTYEFSLITYTYTASPADRPELVINWDDGTTSILARSQTIALPNLITLNKYSGTHTFRGQGTFTVSMEDPNRNGGVVNIPNSINIPFYIETVLNINPFIGNNNSPILLNPPIDNGCVGVPFFHNAAAYDPDGDSLAYELISCKGENGQFIPGYTLPYASSSFSIDPITGTISWLNPTVQGEYNVAFLIKEYRRGLLIGSITRDMQITIISCNNNPPVINTITDTCIEVGETLNLQIKASDIDNDNITLNATGGPLVLKNSKATFPQSTTGQGTVQAPFQWTPICEHVQQQPYQVIFKATDNGSPINLVDIKTLFIKVVAPAPQNLVANPSGNTIKLKWSSDYCKNIKKYDIYRHNGYINYHPNKCETGVPAWTGYVKIGSTKNSTDTSYIDSEGGKGLLLGEDYCYMIVATFNDEAESYPSLEACASLVKDIPVITNVSVDSTDAISGKITIMWSMPDSIDYTATPGPFKYLIYHNTEGFGKPMQLIDSTASITDTIYSNKNIDTYNKTNYYKIKLINNSLNNKFEIGETQIAGNVYITAIGKDNKVKLQWNEKVPWTNNLYIIYRKNASNTFDSIGTSNTQTYTDSLLSNGVNYCYLVKSVGQYQAPGFINPIINWSQETCATATDNEAPCAPILNCSTNCVNVENNLIWNNPNNSCANDVVAYKLFYTNNISLDYTMIYNPLSATDTSFLHTNLSTIVGCYYVIAIDSFNNESSRSNLFCSDIDSCSLYRLPNVFTPNGDLSNDYFCPFPYDFVEKVEMKIFNRWGELVFETKNPNIMWDGKDMNTKKECSEGVYFYDCDVYENHFYGLKIRKLKGTISLYR